MNKKVSGDLMERRKLQNTTHFVMVEKQLYKRDPVEGAPFKVCVLT